ncbi:MAG: DNA primase [Solirubrobacteraceae bacterium]|nr:DNA primase [Solirubrobacteraceae bacterium]
MARYSEESIERVRQAVDMLDLVGARTELRRAGQQWMGACPFHDERTPSFSVDAESKVFHCFGCGEGGDLFRFVELTEGLGFREAVEHLADRYGVTLDVADEDPRAAESRRKRERLLELLERTAAWYVRTLWESDEAAGPRHYLAERGLEEQALRAFRVGYAPSQWDGLLLASRRGGFGARELWDAGLVRRGRNGRLFDFFRRRIQFPLCDARGRVLGFGGRAVGPTQQPKYVNSTDNEVFHKGRHLFGADLARTAAAKAGHVVLCEGYTDVIALHQAGLRNVVGLMGTALTDDQVGELTRLAPVVLLALDADSAGQQAMMRAARVAAGRRLELRVVPLPRGQDPADLLLSEGAEGMRERVRASIPFVRFRVERALDRDDLADAEGKDEAVSALQPVFADLPASALRDELLELAADRLGASPVKLREWLFPGGRAEERHAAPGRRPSTPGGEPGDRPIVGVRPADDRRSRMTATLDQAGRIERAFLAQCLALPEDGAAALAGFDIERDITLPAHRRVAAMLLERPGRPLQAPPGDEELTRIVAELQVRAAQADATRAALEAERLRMRVARADREIVAAKAAGGAGLVELVHRRDELRAALERQVGEALDQTKSVEG